VLNRLLLLLSSLFHLQNYSSNSTVELLSQMAAEAAAFSADVAAVVAAGSSQSDGSTRSSHR
jgi:hypothetical protein